MSRPTRDLAARMSGTNLVKAKDHNSAVVLDIIRAEGPISRAEIARASSLSRQTVQNIVAALDDLGLLEMKAGKAQGRGHPGVNVSLRPDAALFVGAHVERTQVSVVLADLFGRVLWNAHLPLPDQTINAIRRTLAQGVTQIRQAMPDLQARILGCGIAAAGSFSPAVGVEDPTGFSGLGTADSLAALERELDLPVALGNDANAAAMGEALHGDLPTTEDFATLHFGAGLGTAMMIRGEPYTGNFGTAGELGHVQIDPDGPLCPCGRRGCLEQLLSFAALCRHLGLSPDDPTSHDEVTTLVAQGDARLRDWITGAAPRFTQAVQMLDALQSPARIVVTGSVQTPLLEALITAATPLPLRIGSDQSILVQTGGGGEWSIAVGAASMSLSLHFAPSMSRLLL